MPRRISPRKAIQGHSQPALFCKIIPCSRFTAPFAGGIFIENEDTLGNDQIPATFKCDCGGLVNVPHPYLRGKNVLPDFVQAIPAKSCKCPLARSCHAPREEQHLSYVAPRVPRIHSKKASCTEPARHFLDTRVFLTVFESESRKTRKGIEANDLFVGCRWRKHFQKFVPTKIGFPKINAEISVMAGKICGLFEQLIVGELPNEGASACVNGEQIEIVSNLVRISFSQ